MLEQRAIAAILGALDNKIEENTRTERLCGALASAFFADVTTQEQRLSDVATVIMGQSPPGSTYNDVGDGLPFYQGRRDFGYHFPSERVWCSSPTRIAERHDVLLSVRAPVGTLNVATGRCAIGRGVAAIRCEALPRILFHALDADKSVWTPYEHEGTVFGSIGKLQLNALPIKWPIDATKGLETKLEALDALVEAIEEETARLVSMRDALLPRLLSGQIQVRDPEFLMEGVA